jgi:hypothetical protein
MLVSVHHPGASKHKAHLSGRLATSTYAPDLPIERDVVGIARDATRIGFGCRLMLRRHPLGMMLRGLACEGWRARQQRHHHDRDQRSHFRSSLHPQVFSSGHPAR